MKRDLRELPVPEHRDGFWDDLATRLGDEVQELPVADDARRFPGWLLAPAAAVVVVVAVIGVSGLLGGQEEGALEDVGPELGGVTTETTSVAETVTTLDQSLPDAPWAVPGPVPVDTVPQVLIDEWTTAENRTWCSALAITDPSLTDGYTPRGAEFSGGWGVAYDAPGLRSAFGVAGAGLVREPDMATRWPTVQHYVDGSVVGYGGEGLDETNPRRLGEFVVGGQGCMYQVWSELGDEHLASVIDSLRFVDGMQAEPVELVTEVEVRDGGVAPWVVNSPTDVIPFVPEGRAEAGLEGPLLLPTTIEFETAEIRLADVGAWALAWDVAGLAGHDAFNVPCAECGRGVIGFGELEPNSEVSAPGGRPLRIEYDDGSYIEIGYYIGDDRLPPDRPQFVASDTGEPIASGYRAHVVVTDGRQYILWSHLGLDHLLGLVEGLREVGW